MRRALALFVLLVPALAEAKGFTLPHVGGKNDKAAAQQMVRRGLPYARLGASRRDTPTVLVGAHREDLKGVVLYRMTRDELRSESTMREAMAARARVRHGTLLIPLE